MRTAAIYARYSTDLQNERSIADQVAMARAYAAKNDLSVVETYSDAAASGGSMFGRDGLFNLMADARSGLFKVLIVESLDRLSRDMADSAEIHKRLTFAGVEIATLNEGVATTLTVGLRSMMGQLYREDLAHKTRRGMAGMVRQGKSAGGRSYGYDIDPRAKGESIINEAEAAIVRRIFEDYAGGKSPLAIATDLNREGIPAPRARHWQHTAILGSAKELTGILRNPLYDGRRVWNKRAFHKDPDSGGRVSRMNPREDWHSADAEHLRIIDRGLFVRVQQLLGDGSKTHAQAGSARRHKRLLAGLLKCAGCGGVLTVVGKDKSGKHRMGCSAHMSGKPCTAPKTFYYEKVEALVIDTMRAGLEDHEAMAEYVRVYNETRLELARQAGAKRRQIEKRITDLDGEITRALNLLMKGIGSEDRMGAEIRAKEAQLVELKAELALEPATPDVVGLHPQTIATYHRQLRDLQAELAGQGEAKRSPRMAELMRDLVHSITVLPDTTKVGGFKIVIDGNLRVFLNDCASWGTVGAGARFELTTFRL